MNDNPYYMRFGATENHFYSRNEDGDLLPRPACNNDGEPPTGPFKPTRPMCNKCRSIRVAMVVLD